MKIAINKILTINKKEPKTPIEVMVKVQEECGELAVELLKHIDRKGSNGDTKSIIRRKILEESCDVIITITSILGKFGFNEKDIAKMIKFKCNKWKSNIKKYKEWKKD